MIIISLIICRHGISAGKNDILGRIHKGEMLNDLGSLDRCIGDAACTNYAL